jgi:predicted transcriptional regulator
MVTFLEVFARASMAPQELSVEASVPLETILRLQRGGQASKRDVRRILRVLNSRLEKPVQIRDLPASQILWE